MSDHELLVILKKRSCAIRSKKSNHRPLSHTEMIREALDNGQFACGIFIDLQKAFETFELQIC